MRHRSPRPKLDIRHLRPFLAELVGRVAAAGVRSFRAVVAGAAAVLLGGTSMVTSSLASDVGATIATGRPHTESQAPSDPVTSGGGQGPVASPTHRQSAAHTPPPAPTTASTPSKNPSSPRPTPTRRSASTSPSSLVPSTSPTSPLPSTPMSTAPDVSPSPPVIVDTAAPRTSATTSWATRDSWVVALSADEPATFECSLDSGPYQPCSSTQAYFNLRGRHTLSVQATDLAGNTDPSPVELTWNPAMDMSRQD